MMLDLKMNNHSFLSPSSVFRDSASARLSTAMAKKTFSRMSEQRVPWRFSTINHRRISLVFPLSPPPEQTFIIKKLPWKLKFKHDSNSNRCLWQDTVSTDKEDDEVEAHNHPAGWRTSVGHDSIVHDGVPVFSRQDLKSIMLTVMRQLSELQEDWDNIWHKCTTTNTDFSHWHCSSTFTKNLQNKRHHKKVLIRC